MFYLQGAQVRLPFLLVVGNWPGKNDATEFSTFNFPSVTAKPAAVEVKLLLKEWSM